MVITWFYNSVRRRPWIVLVETYTSRDLKHVCNQLGTDGSSRLVLLVLTRIGKAGDNSSDPSGRGSSTSVNHDEELHQTIVDISRSSGLKDENILITNRLSNRNTGLSVGVVQ
jgi:hypothetical protein